MARPKKLRVTRAQCRCNCFNPDKASSGDGVSIASDELEALKLYDVDELDQVTASKKMKISQPTFARILASAHKKVSGAIIGSRKINIGASK